MHCISICMYCVLLFASADDNSEMDLHARAKRGVSELSDLKPESIDKRQREFIGKRMRDFVGKRSAIPSDEDDGDILLPSEIFPEDIQTEKRYRDFLGKRATSNDEIMKRMRDFVGKRSDEELGENDDKRMREFVGKRSSDDEFSEVYDDPGYQDQTEERFTGYDKRMRDFVGKRSLDASTLAALEKRFRDFVGKREFPEDFFRITQRYFVRKPKYIRQIVGKRAYPTDMDTYDQEKRMRDFVGKRMRDFVGKRMRDFVGK